MKEHQKECNCEQCIRIVKLPIIDYDTIDFSEFNNIDLFKQEEKKNDNGNE